MTRLLTLLRRQQIGGDDVAQGVPRQIGECVFSTAPEAANSVLSQLANHRVFGRLGSVLGVNYRFFTGYLSSGLETGPP
jgi:hypothetical protein